MRSQRTDHSFIRSPEDAEQFQIHRDCYLEGILNNEVDSDSSGRG